MMQGRMFWLVWLLVGCQMAWMTLRAFQAPWTWNLYQILAAIFLAALLTGVVLLALLWQRGGLEGIRIKAADFEAEIETPGSAIGRNWNIAFWIVAILTAMVYFHMEGGLAS